jgi:hypothetical protein
MAIEPGRSKVVVWTQKGIIAIYHVSNLSFVASWTPPNIPWFNDTTNQITFSSDGQLCIVETDYHNPITVLDMTTALPVHTVSQSDGVRIARFLNGSNDVLAVVCFSSFLIADLVANASYQNPAIMADVYVSDDNSNLFTCHNN